MLPGPIVGLLFAFISSVSRCRLVPVLPEDCALFLTTFKLIFSLLTSLCSVFLEGDCYLPNNFFDGEFWIGFEAFNLPVFGLQQGFFEASVKTVKFDFTPNSNSCKFILASPSMSNLLKILTNSCFEAIWPYARKNLLILFESRNP